MSLHTHMGLLCRVRHYSSSCLQLLHTSSKCQCTDCFPLLQRLSIHCMALSSFVAFAFPTYRVESWENEALGPMKWPRVRYSFLYWHTARD